MKLGTRSVLYGVHAFWYHPIVVARAWRHVYNRWPNWWELICIIFHDTPGYWGKPNMDGDEGRRHPEKGAELARLIVNWLGGDENAAHQLTLYHSSHYARLNNAKPSALYLPDKASILFEPRWWYLFRAKLSGEVYEYIGNSPLANLPPDLRTPEVWYNWYKTKVKQKLDENKSIH